MSISRMLSTSPEINLYNNCPEECANVNSVGRGTSRKMVLWEDPMIPNYPGSKTILCIDDDAGVLSYHRALFERSGH
jgi:hypothetical protein